MTKTYTEQDALEYVEENIEGIMNSYHDYDGIPSFMKETPKFVDLWKAGCWLNHLLEENGATEDEVKDIGFVHGQRAVFGDPYKWAVAYLNEFVSTKSVSDKPGEKLASRINREAGL